MLFQSLWYWIKYCSTTLFAVPITNIYVLRHLSSAWFHWHWRRSPHLCLQRAQPLVQLQQQAVSGHRQHAAHVVLQVPADGSTERARHQACRVKRVDARRLSELVEAQVRHAAAEEATGGVGQGLRRQPRQANIPLQGELACRLSKGQSSRSNIKTT